jgi:hypothetical protein
MAATPTGNGYWLVASDGGIFAFGDARFSGSTGALALAQPITGMAATPTGDGYWLVATDGGVFAFGDAAFHGAAAAHPGRRTVVGLVPSPSGGGYWQAATSGELFGFGDAAALGHPAALTRPIVGIVASPAAGTGTTGLPARPGSSPDPPTTSPTTMTTPPAPPWTAPHYFASTANHSWGTSPSTNDDNKAGRVLALAEAGDVVFVAGEFAGAALPDQAKNGDSTCRPDAAVPPPPDTCVLRPFLFALDVHTGALLDWDAHPDDAVLSLAVSADGTKLYTGGRFTSIGGAPAGRIARLDIATGRADPTFTPPKANSGVRAMALHGDTLYIGGTFDRLGAADVPSGLAAIDAAAGALRTGWTAPANTGGRFFGHTGIPTEDGNPGVINDMAVSGDGAYLFVGGDFLHFGGQSGLLTLDAATGQPSSWQAVPDRPRPVFGLAVWPGDGRSVIAATGGFGGTTQFFTTAGPTAPLWIGRVDGDATDVAATTERVYLVGHFDHEVPNKNDPCLRHAPVTCSRGTAHRKLVAFDAATGHVDPSFTAQSNTAQGPYAAFIGRNHLYVGGDFTMVGPIGDLRPQPGFAQFDRIAEPGPAPPVDTDPATSHPTTTATSKRH